MVGTDPVSIAVGTASDSILESPSKKRRVMTDAPELTVYYFDFAGKAEPIRLLLNYLGIPFTDYRFQDGDEFRKMKESGELAFGQVPALRVKTQDGKETLLTQTGSMLRYVAKLGAQMGKTEVYPEDDVQACRVDAIMDQMADMMTGFMAAKYAPRFGYAFLEEQPELKQKVFDACNDEVLPRHLEFLESSIGESGWLVDGVPGVGPSIAEFLWAPMLETFANGYTGNKDLLLPYEKLCSLKTRFYGLEKISAYYEARK